MAIDEKLKMNFLNSITGFILSKSLKIKCHSSNWHSEPERNETTGKMIELLLQSAQDAE